MKKKAVCVVPVQLYDAELPGVYAAGQVLEGERAELALARHPDYFQPVEPATKKGEK
jgi:hypothetical protein